MIESIEKFWCPTISSDDLGTLTLVNGSASWSAVACHRFGLADNRRLRKRMIERSASSARQKRWQATALQDLLLCPVNRMEDAKLMNHVERFRA